MSGSVIDPEFKNSVSSIIEKYKHSRATRFAKSNSVSNDEVYAHNQIPVWFLVKRFKTQNNIKSRLFKSLTDEQKQSWLKFYDENKHLTLMTNEKHKEFHDSNIFDMKTGTWKNINPHVATIEIAPLTTSSLTLTSAPNEQHKSRIKKLSNDSETSPSSTSPNEQHKRKSQTKSSPLPSSNDTEDTKPSSTSPSSSPSTRKRVKVKKNTN